MTRSTFVCTALFLALAACRNSNSGDDTVDAASSDSVNTDDATIYEIQGALPVGTQVNIRGVVVTAIDNYGAKVGNLWVQEPAGGAYSGVLVFGADLTELGALHVGDLVDIENVVKDEFALSDDTSGRTTTEMTPPDGGVISVTKVGDGTPATPEVVDALAIGQLADPAAQDAEWEKWEGVLITVEHVGVVGSTRQIGTTDPTFLKFPITGPLEVESTMALLPTVAAGDCLASVTGVGDYFYDWLLEPRDGAEVVTGGADCPAHEADATVCADGIDNDANGYVDCADNFCLAIPACTNDVTIVDVQTANGVADGDSVHIATSYVTAIDDIGTSKGFYAADALQGAANNGVYVYTGSALPANLAIGAVAEITGVVDEFDVGTPPAGDTLTEINARNGIVTITPATNTPLPLTGVAPNTLKDLTNGEPYEGVLVQLSNVKVTNNAIGNDRLEVTDNSGQTIIVDDDAYDYAAATYPATTTCFATLTGVMSVNLTDNERRLMPRLVGDMNASGGACN